MPLDSGAEPRFNAAWTAERFHLAAALPSAMRSLPVMSLGGRRPASSAVGFRPVGTLVARPVKVHDRRWVTSWLEAYRRDAAGWRANSSIEGGAR
jgi:hypothetical protein